MKVDEVSGQQLKILQRLSILAMAIDTSVAGSVPSPTVTMEDVDRVSKGEGQQVGAVRIPRGFGVRTDDARIPFLGQYQSMLLLHYLHGYVHDWNRLQYGR